MSRSVPTRGVLFMHARSCAYTMFSGVMAGSPRSQLYPPGSQYQLSRVCVNKVDRSPCDSEPRHMNWSSFVSLRSWTGERRDGLEWPQERVEMDSEAFGTTSDKCVGWVHVFFWYIARGAPL